MFSHRVAWEPALNPLAVLERARRDAGLPIVDLTASNPTVVGLRYPREALRHALAHPDVATYEPSPRGLQTARAAVAQRYGRRGVAVSAEAVWLTASSSESYAQLFKLLCDPGDSVLVPQPSYPLFDFLTRLEGVRAVPYRLAYDGEWHVDFASVSDALTAAETDRPAGGRVRALIVVSPNNPTGSFTKRRELERLAALCAARQLALISDEVFADYAFAPDTAPEGDDRRVLCAAAAPTTREALTFSLGGLSKSCGLPQLKLGWIVVGGPPALVDAAWARWELIADTTLSVNTPVQLAATQLLALGEEIQRQISARVAANRATLQHLLTPSAACTLLGIEGGWSAILRVPGVWSDEAWAQTLLREDGVLVHPGYLFDMPRGTFLVVSLLPQPDAFARAAGALVHRCGGGGEAIR